MTLTPTPTELMTLLDAAGLDAQQYSGRDMSGKYCPAFRVAWASDILAAGFEIAQAAANDGDGIRAMLSNAKTDSMGRGIVVYFPRYTFEPASSPAVEAP